jgi:D-3-phosphoglycerate dehydrogenase
MGPTILVITPVKHIKGVIDILESIGEVIYLDDPTPETVAERIIEVEAIYTNPNKSDVFISGELINAGDPLEVICTASTGTNHIDLESAAEAGVEVLSLTEEREVINKISSTAEHAFALMMAGLRQIPQAWDSVRDGEWDYEPFTGRQLDYLTIGVIGYGRLGSLLASYCRPFGSDVMVYDPWKDVDADWITQVDDVEALLEASDVVSLHVHVTDETRGMVDESWFEQMKEDVTLVNTSRGEIVDEQALMTYLDANPRAYYATDVLADEVRSDDQNAFKQWAIDSDQVVITPHIAGMTREGQMIAYQHAATRLQEFFA